MKKRIVVVDDHPIVRQGFVLLINQESDLEVVGQAEDPSAALTIISATKPDLVLVDLSLKNGDGLEMIKDLSRLYPELLMLAVSLHDENVYAERALRAGARGYIMKSEATDSVMIAIRQVLSGGFFLSAKMNERLLTRLTAAGKQDTIDPMARLSDREFEVFQLIGQGYDTRLIAESLCLSIKTIETYKSHLKTKLDLKNSTELMQRAVEWSVKHRR
ncbi:response regulator [Sediminispirochaeta smaragdinae]|uniref:Two component transcriptional regulator, LuxR family n=1 Tax=Sediminispirochaeta smaragdinae (strain DSM 11293 / JCM 15392 / SEBR 4228) TaxID=573413 RepID=E1R6D3_SEDSS|nr:response regulator transcription factor [Sediminispirochaeta smaragdinae]ADK80951.1 two component transcriptional regulator, LuxR family [Sediminispirochaeta smaragdinae DSM 11293]